jgi:hypothetical protein
MVPPGSTAFVSPRPARPAALPLVGTVVELVVVVAPPVAGARLPPVVVVVSSPRRYLPSSVPPQPATRIAPVAIRAVAAVTLRLANRRSPALGAKRRSLPTAQSGFPAGSTGSVGAVDKHLFLSDAWFDEVRRLHEAVGGAAPEGAEIRMNLMITTTPFDGDLPMHMVAAGGRADWGKGQLDDADVTLTLAYDTARAIFVDGNPQAAIEAFMAGRIIVQGDITKLMVMQASGPGSAASELTRALQEITE